MPSAAPPYQDEKAEKLADCQPHRPETMLPTQQPAPSLMGKREK